MKRSGSKLALLGAPPPGWPAWLAGHPRWSRGSPERLRVFWGNGAPPPIWLAGSTPLLWVSRHSPGSGFFAGPGPRGWLPLGRWRQLVGPALQALEAGLSVRGPLRRDAVSASAEGLTPREQEVLGLIAGGKANKEIAVELGISESTVKFHLAALYHKLGAVNRAQAVRRGLEEGYRPL